MQKIPITKPSITELEISYVNDAIRNGWGEKCYDYIKKFERNFVSYLEVKHALATSSCTGAIHLGFAALGFKPGDEVIVPDITWIASVAPLIHLGLKPIFVDVLPTTWCINPDEIKKAITSKTRAVLAVHLYGNVCELDQISKICDDNNLILVEDGAEALGSEYQGKKVGSFGEFSVFSFHGTKSMTTGEGGMIVTNSADLIRKISILADHGRVPEEVKMFYPHFIGYKYKMSNLQAALGCAQLERIDELVNKKRQVFDWYKNAFNGINCKMNYEQDYVKNSYWMPTVIFNDFDEKKRDNLILHLKKNGIDTRPFFYPLSTLPILKSENIKVVAESFYLKGINLPSYFDIKENDIVELFEHINYYLSNG